MGVRCAGIGDNPNFFILGKTSFKKNLLNEELFSKVFVFWFHFIKKYL
jgi:hypothetical protein